jgi:hypothetical protein
MVDSRWPSSQLRAHWLTSAVSVLPSLKRRLRHKARDVITVSRKEGSVTRREGAVYMTVQEVEAGAPHGPVSQVVGAVSSPNTSIPGFHAPLSSLTLHHSMVKSRNSCQYAAILTLREHIERVSNLCRRMSVHWYAFHHISGFAMGHGEPQNNACPHG